MAVEQFAPVLSGLTLSAQQWQNLTFLHWPVDPAALAGRFPPGVRADTIEGRSYVGLVPFHMHGAGPGPRPAVPYFGDFSETNVRLYSVDDAGRHGIVFLTLEAQRLATVLLARISLGLPYAWSRMSEDRREEHARGDVRRYVSRRRWPERRGDGPSSTVAVRVGAPVRASPLEVWLTSRWGLHTRVAGRTMWVPNQHDPWPLYAAELTELDRDLVARCGVDVDDAQMLRPLWSPGVRTTFGRPVIVGR